MAEALQLQVEDLEGAVEVEGGWMEGSVQVCGGNDHLELKQASLQSAVKVCQNLCRSDGGGHLDGNEFEHDDGHCEMTASTQASAAGMLWGGQMVG